MNIVYNDNEIEKLCKDFKLAKKKYREKIAIRLFQAINFIETAENLKLVIDYRPFNFHDLKGDKDGQYAIDIGSRKDGYRLILLFEESKKEVFGSALNITKVIFKEMGNHYE